MAFGSKQKGSIAEREVCGFIKPWWNQLEPEALFVRTPLSGGWQKSDGDRGAFRATGDIMTTALLWPFDVEVKRRETWKEVTFAAGLQSPVWAWWIQAQLSARIRGLEPMLWLRHNRTPWIVVLNEAYVTTETCLDIDPLYVWGEKLNAVNYGAKWPIAYRASDLLSVHPSAVMKSI